MTCGQANPALPAPAQPWSEWRTDRAPLADRGQLSGFLRALGAEDSGLDEADAGANVTLWRVREGATLLHEGAPAQALYVLRSGSLKCIRTLEDGYEQVLAFTQPGELFGFEALHSGRQPSGVVALEDSSVYALPLQGLRALRQRCAPLDQALQMALSRQLVRAAGTAEMMAAVAADARLARSLLWMSARMAEAGRSPRRLNLRMCRRDIASLLGVAHETVSRSFGLLAEAGLVKVENREVEILDLDALRRRGRSTRGPVDAGANPARQASAAKAAPTAPAPWFPGPVALATA